MKTTAPLPLLGLGSGRVRTDLVCIVQALAPGDEQTGVYLARSLEDPKSLHDPKSTFEVRFRQVASVGELICELTEIQVLAGAGRYPLIHVDAHGTTAGLHVGSDVVSWSVFLEYSREINRRCHNNLVVVLAVCYGLHAVMAPFLEGGIGAFRAVSPYFALLGVEGQLPEREVDLVFGPFYDTLLGGGSLASALEHFRHPPARNDGRVVPLEYGVVRSDELLFNAFVGYVAGGCSRRAVDQATEALLTRGVKAGLVLPRQFRGARRLIRRSLQAWYWELETYKARYLLADHPRNVGRFRFTALDVQREVEKHKAGMWRANRSRARPRV